MKLYSPLIYKAMKTAYDAHDGQLDKSGVPYIYHPIAVAEQMDTEEEIVTALLHDVIEDSPVTLNDLAREGFPTSVLDALRLLTHRDGVDYTMYLMGIAENPLAVKVKLADLNHNNDPLRNAILPTEDAASYKEKYDRAYALLTSIIKKDGYIQVASAAPKDGEQERECK